MKLYEFAFDTTTIQVFAKSLGEAESFILASEDIYFKRGGHLYIDWSDGNRSKCERITINIPTITKGIFKQITFG